MSNLQSREEYLQQSYNLDREQGVRADKIWNGPMRDFPEPLQRIVRDAGLRYGHSGDVIWECIVAFVKGQTLPEYLGEYEEHE